MNPRELLERKKLQSPFVSLTQDGESVEGMIMDMKQITKQGYAGEDMEVMRIVLLCNIPGIGIVQKNFDNGSMRWLQTLVDADAQKGDHVRIVRHGAHKSTKTYYEMLVLQRNPTPASAPQGQYPATGSLYAPPIQPSIDEPPMPSDDEIPQEIDDESAIMDGDIPE